MHDCCSSSCEIERAADTCGRCGSRGQPVPRETLESLLTADARERLRPGPYFFDRNRSCEVIYFSNEHNSYFIKSDLSIRVGLKESEPPITICYCFGHTEESARHEIANTGRSTVAEAITKEIQAGNCACEVKNPAGRCCLGEVKKTVQAIVSELGMIPISGRR